MVFWDLDGAADLDISREDMDAAIAQGLVEGSATHSTYIENRNSLLDAILHSRYSNLYNLLHNHVDSPETYLGIVRNKILVDIQGDDLLYQIFTSNILQRNPGDEAPFLEFIQRVCSVKGISKPGCGGFGTKNGKTTWRESTATLAHLTFLFLFLLWIRDP